MKKLLNPVFRKEVKTSLRTWRAFITVTIYIIVLLAVTGLTLASFLNFSMYSGFNPQQSTTLYITMSGFQLGLIMLVVPAITGSSISGERERQTFDLLLATKMSTMSIILGKLFSSLIVVSLLIVASLPVFGIIIYFGSVSIINLFAMMLFLLLISMFVGSITIFFSSVFKRTVVAIIATYFVIGAISLGTIFGVSIFTMLLAPKIQLASAPILPIYSVFSINPFIAFMGVADSQLGSFTVNSLIESMTYNFRYGSGYMGVTNHIDLPIWVPNGVFSIIVTIIMVALSSFVIRPTRKSKMYK